MITKFGFFLLLTSFQFGFGQAGVPFGVWKIDVSHIQREKNGDFEIQYSWGRKEATLKDHDGIATLATTQSLLGNLARDAFMKSHGFLEGQMETKLDLPLSEALPEGASRILTVQRDALEKILKSLDEASATLKIPLDEQGLVGTNISLKDAYQVIRGLLSRFDAKKMWTLRDIAERGDVIRKLVGAGGPYKIKMQDGAESRTFEQSLTDVQSPPNNSFLSGWIGNGNFSPLDVPSLSHVYVSGDMDQLARRYDIGNGLRAQSSDGKPRGNSRDRMNHR